MIPVRSMTNRETDIYYRNCLFFCNCTKLFKGYTTYWMKM